MPGEGPTLPKRWDPRISINKIVQLTDVVKPKVEDIVLEFWIAHEMIVTKRAPGWTWGRFCEEAGYHRATPYRWFEKYGLPITIIPPALPSVAKATTDKPLKKHTKHELKKQLAEIGQAIKEGKVSDDDIQKVSRDIGEAMKTQVASPRVTAPRTTLAR
jgi:hypothetical protein